MDLDVLCVSGISRSDHSNKKAVVSAQRAYVPDRIALSCPIAATSVGQLEITNLTVVGPFVKLVQQGRFHGCPGCCVPMP